MTTTVETVDIRAAREARPMPGGANRMHAFPGEIRVNTVTRDGKPFFEVDGYATTFNQQYDMWDMFGPYKEGVKGNALDKSLAAGPDVAFLVNHRGVTMARTTNDSLEISKDKHGLGAHAYLNSDRQDVRDLVSAINDKLVDQMSFAFLLLDGEWNWAEDSGKEYDEFWITEADINRGDVSAVNYGANPYTSIEARAAEWLADAERMPVSVARAALKKLTDRCDHVADKAPAVVPAGETSADERQAMSVELLRRRLIVA